MQTSPLADQIVQAFDTMSEQLQAAAQYVLNQPHEVALLSMREQARQAGVQPATMTRLAKHLGLAGYEDIRQRHADAMRGDVTGFAGRVGAQAKSQKLKGDQVLAADMLGGIAAQVSQLSQPQSLEMLVEAARLLGTARRIYCLGLRSSHSPAWHLHYILSLAGKHSIMLDAVGGIGADALGSASAEDVMVAVSVLPYTRQTIEIADYAGEASVPLIAITDSLVAPLAQLAACTLVVPTESPSFLHTMSPAFVVAEVLGALVAGQAGDAAGAALAAVDRQSAALNIHLKTRVKRP
ncbi:MurR/RpiR family transcriptional regulator [Shinella sp. 838]|uniref:MurR/RpiR family transcriptional regulator n=1 Tax=unclassified Shinella TaxID=2643062 RepID=UPI0003C536D1|nr:MULTISPECIES: MurR/RpiR family transcriptional regulator [unclassified Shinella]EYR77526.1 transcriptional regulator, RpiR family [Shinella sp. DD12]MCA0345031.1 MurR/RpiR family transcriptional regulator [Pseudomonadota bacterium]MDG4672791.1 MurR/RpiR family transcriptional regulator [Shinella sp. 838]